MAKRTNAERDLEREEVAAALRELADEFESGEAEIDVPVGNKRVTLRPRETVTYEIGIVERSSRLRKDREAIEMELRWKSG